jgi:hypothetical protein
MFKWIMVIATLCVALSLAGTATASDWSSNRFDQGASAIAGHSTHVWCESSWADWVHAGDEYGEDWANVFGFTAQVTTTVYLNPDVCFSLHVLLSGGDVGTVNASMALLTLAHEASHQAGYWDEGEAECHALPKVEALAVGYFGVRAKALKPYTATKKRRVGIRINGHTVIRTLTAKVIRYRQVRNPWLTRLNADMMAWHNTAPAEYRTFC